jgi:hypothetical protein
MPRSHRPSNSAIHRALSRQDRFPANATTPRVIRLTTWIGRLQPTDPGSGSGLGFDGAHVNVRSSEPDDTAIDLSDPVPLGNKMSIVTCGSSGYQAARDREDPGGLGCQELPLPLAKPTRRRIDARSTQDLPHGGRRNCHAQLRELAMYPPVSPRGFPLARRTTRRAAPGTVGGRPGLRRLFVSYFLAASLRCQASSVPGVTGKTSGQRLRGTSRAQRGPPGPASRLVPHPAGVPPQYRVLVPEHQQLSILRQVTAEH